MRSVSCHLPVVLGSPSGVQPRLTLHTGIDTASQHYMYGTSHYGGLCVDTGSDATEASTGTVIPSLVVPSTAGNAGRELSVLSRNNARKPNHYRDPRSVKSEMRPQKKGREKWRWLILGGATARTPRRAGRHPIGLPNHTFPAGANPFDGPSRLHGVKTRPESGSLSPTREEPAGAGPEGHAPVRPPAATGVPTAAPCSAHLGDATQRSRCWPKTARRRPAPPRATRPQRGSCSCRCVPTPGDGPQRGHRPALPSR